MYDTKSGLRMPMAMVFDLMIAICRIYMHVGEFYCIANEENSHRY